MGSHYFRSLFIAAPFIYLNVNEIAEVEAPGLPQQLALEILQSRIGPLDEHSLHVTGSLLVTRHFGLWDCVVHAISASPRHLVDGRQTVTRAHDAFLERVQRQAGHEDPSLFAEAHLSGRVSGQRRVHQDDAVWLFESIGDGGAVGDQGLGWGVESDIPLHFHGWTFDLLALRMHRHTAALRG